MPRRRNTVRAQAKKTIRCAVYTRKSTEEGLDQAFNTLDAQREACEAYIKSQQHEGWTLITDHYDDGGFSGGNMERPALRRLLSDIEQRRIDTVVVYKVDRLTRSLRDFARIVDQFDQYEVSFVSVTQQFNTTTSMGRLTLNMLLSFAQFEREVTGERIRDKIAASKRRGLWMGGFPPLGYEARNRKLVIVEHEADTVRDIFSRYVDLRSVADLKAALDRDGVLSKRRKSKSGRVAGGQPIQRGALYMMLRNPIYRGQIAHQGEVYEGQHDAVIDASLWDQVQQTLQRNRVDRSRGRNTEQPSLLAGRIFDESGDRMTPSHARRKKKRYRYYVSNRLIVDRKSTDTTGWRVPAQDIERLVLERIGQFLNSESELYAALEDLVPESKARVELTARIISRTAPWSSLPVVRRKTLLQDALERVHVGAGRIDVAVSVQALVQLSEHRDRDALSSAAGVNGGLRESTITLSIPAQLKRAGMEMRLVVDGQDHLARTEPDRSLHRLLGQAWRFQQVLLSSRGQSVAEMAESVGITPTNFARILKVSFLAPAVIEFMLRNRHPLELTAHRLWREVEIPVSWEEQGQRFCVPGD